MYSCSASSSPCCVNTSGAKRPKAVALVGMLYTRHNPPPTVLTARHRHCLVVHRCTSLRTSKRSLRTSWPMCVLLSGLCVHKWPACTLLHTCSALALAYNTWPHSLHHDQRNATQRTVVTTAANDALLHVRQLRLSHTTALCRTCTWLWAEEAPAAAAGIHPSPPSHHTIHCALWIQPGRQQWPLCTRTLSAA
jgi:hypothetical protein